MNRLIGLISLFITACGQVDGYAPQYGLEGPTMGPDGFVVRAKAQVFVSTNRRSNVKLEAVSNGSTVVTYNNAPNTQFAINTAAFLPGAMTGDTLSLGNVSLAQLSDNHLKVCNPGGTTKCTLAIIRVYTTGTIAGFVNTADQYGAPVFASGLNPNVPIGLNSGGSVQVQTYTIPSIVHKLSLANFPSPSYNISSDFSNAGDGSYSMTFVVEYALAP